MATIPREIRDKAQRVCAEYIGGAWTSISSEDLELQQITKGMCNMSIRCSLPKDVKPEEDEPTEVLFKLILNRFQRSTFAIMTENLTVALLAQQKLAPKLYGVFEDGRIEEFVASRTINPDELQNLDIYEALAKKIAQFHSFKAPVNKNPRSQTSWYAMFREALKDVQTNKIFREGNDPDTQLKLDELLALPLQTEIDWQRTYVHPSKSPIVFSHTDLQVNNILLRTNPSGDLLQLVDFEYSGYNYRAYDFASVFLGHCYQYATPDPPYFIADWTKFPSLENQKHFISVYLREFQKITGKTFDIQLEIETILDEIKIFYLVQHYTFGLAGIFRFRETEFHIDWLAYAKERYRMYFKHKKQYFGIDTKVKI